MLYYPWFKQRLTALALCPSDLKYLRQKSASLLQQISNNKYINRKKRLRPIGKNKQWRPQHWCRWELFATMPDSRINSWESWFIFNLRKINTNQYYLFRLPGFRNSSMICEYMILQDDKCIIFTVHNWTAVFLKPLANMSFMALFRA